IKRLLAPLIAATSSFSFRWTASVSLFCARWIRKTIRKVTIVVPVLITSCHVSEKPKRGPVASHSTMDPAATAKAQLDPEYFVALVERRSSALLIRLLIADPVGPTRIESTRRANYPRK